RVSTEDPGLRMPPAGAQLTEDQISKLEKWIEEGASWPLAPVDPSHLALPPLVSDEAFARRAFLDTVGVPPTVAELQTFLSSTAPDKRTRLIDQLLDDRRLADHWMSHWLDALAENPSLISATLNSTGPFRWFLDEALQDGRAWDRVVT